MPPVRRVLRILRALGLTLLGILLLTFALVQFQQRLLRHRAEHLLADFQSIRLNQTTWPEAQTLMHRWGAWAHYEGQCTSTHCDYIILLEDAFDRTVSHLHSDRGYAIAGKLVPFYDLLGGKLARIEVHFLTQDGVVVRSSVALSLWVPPHRQPDDAYGYELLLLAKASAALHTQPDKGPWILGSNSQLADHPEYKVGRPSGCSICLSGEVTFTPYLAPSELNALTAYNLSCLNPYRTCLNLPDLLPAAAAWHLYPGLEPAYSLPKQKGAGPCRIPVDARARDADSILAVEVLPAAISPEGRSHPDASHVRVLQTLKTDPGKALPKEFFATSYRENSNDPEQASETLTGGSRYLLFIQQSPSSSESGLDYCAVVPDSAAARLQVQQGLARLDHLRQPEPGARTVW